MYAKTLLLVCLALLAAPAAQAADDPSIKGQLRTDIHEAMQEFLADRTDDGTYRHYDAADDRLLHLKDANLHEGIVKKGDFYVSCADFTDQDGRKIDVDVLAFDFGGKIRAVQGFVHKVDGDKRPYDLEKK